MKQLKVISLISLAVLAAGASASPLADQVAMLQTEINALQNQISQVSVIHSSNSVHTPYDTTDENSPFAAMSKNWFPLYALKAKSKGLNNPVIFGGQVEGDVQYYDGGYQASNYQSGSDIFLKRVYLFTVANPNPNTMAAIALKRSGNNIQFERAFLTVGNLNTNPFYMTAGYAYLPFGLFSGNGPVTDALTTTMFRVSPTDQLVVGFNNQQINANLGVYNTNQHNNLDNFFTNAGITQLFDGVTYTATVGYLNDIRGTNNGVGNAYAAPGASPSTASPFTGGSNGVVDVNGTITYGPYGLLAEYDTTLTSAQYNGQSTGALSAWVVGGTYKNTYQNIPTQFQLSYSQTRNMQNIPMSLPGNVNTGVQTVGTSIKSSWLASVEGEVLNNVYVGPELAYDELYNNSHTYSLTLDVNAYF